ncbi:MAG: hypothetical protein LBL57_08730, partial [Tannerella sp.]|jgi:hypothetical protein|nr:hypothetical protein [Tannerella sp.]
MSRTIYAGAPSLFEQKKYSETEQQIIEQLKVINARQVKLTVMLILVALLPIAAIVLLWLWFYSAKKNLKRRPALIKAEKEEAELHLKMEEEQAVKALPEKDEALPDCRMNGINDKKQESVGTEELLQKSVTEDIARLITKKLPDKKDYVKSLERIDGQYISALKNAYNGNLSIPYIKYCACFSIGMEIGEVSTCFSIEQASVHMVRYRLKKNFGLDNMDDLDVFLRTYENHENLLPAHSKGLPVCEVIKEDLEELINKHLKNKKDYSEKLLHLNEASINNIKDRYDGNLSIQYIKYCICFIIGLEIAEVSACFSIEPASVHGLRYRLKKRFGLGPDDSLELFLSAATNTVSVKTTD